ncbi:MAG: prepilin-type N-terminal cleavage/methylation domain-containing protein [Planctomycetota bacterium]|jgi:prepilin-type N-terminal cleavage/methylation domain-containing protein
MRERGFTLIEMLVVVTILALLATLAGRHVWTAGEKGKKKIALAKCREYHDAVFMWRMFRDGALPSSLDELEAPLDPGDRRGFVHLDPDPWGQAYRLEANGEDVRVFSNGPDREPDTVDDICYEPRDDD